MEKKNNNSVSGHWRVNIRNRFCTQLLFYQCACVWFIGGTDKCDRRPEYWFCSASCPTLERGGGVIYTVMEVWKGAVPNSWLLSYRRFQLLV